MPSDPSIRVRQASSSLELRRWNVANRGISAEASREGSAGPDERRVTGECAEEAVDEVHDTGLGGAGVLIGGDQSGTRSLHDRVLVLVEESGHGRV